MANRILNGNLGIFGSPKNFFFKVTPRFEFIQVPSLRMTVHWHEETAEAVEALNPKRTTKRIESYLDYAELERVLGKLEAGKDSVSIRFGVKKEGKGIKGERGDFCMVGGVLTKNGRHLTLFYRSLELIGGFHYDWTLINELRRELSINLKTVEFWAVEAHTMALRGNSNEKLHRRLMNIYEGMK